MVQGMRAGPERKTFLVYPPEEKRAQMHFSSPLPSPLPLQRVGAGAGWAFQRLLASILETASFFPVPALFMKETMRTYSECLVHHLGPQAL